jgi:hypothetical protein
MVYKLTEGLFTPTFDFEAVIPTEADFKEFEGLKRSFDRKQVSFEEAEEVIKEADKYLIIKYIVLANFYK